MIHYTTIAIGLITGAMLAVLLATVYQLDQRLSHFEQRQTETQAVVIRQAVDKAIKDVFKGPEWAPVNE